MLDHGLPFKPPIFSFQIFANYETLYHALDFSSLPPVYLVSSKSIEWLLPKAKNQIRVPKDVPEKLVILRLEKFS